MFHGSWFCNANGTMNSTVTATAASSADDATQPIRRANCRYCTLKDYHDRYSRARRNDETDDLPRRRDAVPGRSGSARVQSTAGQGADGVQHEVAGGERG